MSTTFLRLVGGRRRSAPPPPPTRPDRQLHPLLLAGAGIVAVTIAAGIPAGASVRA